MTSRFETGRRGGAPCAEAAAPPAAGAFARRWTAVRRCWETTPWLRTAAALAWLWLCVLVFFARSILFGWVYYESDTLNYYLPVREVYDAALARGELPLWTSTIYGGFPLFADGEGGMLYPLNAALTWLLPPLSARLWQLMLRFWLAGAFTFWFARVLGLGRLPGLVAGLVFAFGSFTVGQLHHTNVGNSAIWLPAVLACAELASRRQGLPRLGWAALGGIALGNAMLAIHVQPVLMTLYALALWCLFRAAPHLWAAAAALQPRLGRSFAGRSEPAGATSASPSGYDAVAPRPLPGAPPTAEETRRSSRRGWIEGLAVLLIAPSMAVVGIGLAAAQLVPLYELSRFSARGDGVSYEYATTYGPTLFNLIGLLLPSFFQGADGRWWSLWSKWESTIYVGLAPLLLAAAAALGRRTRETWLFAAVALVSLLIALGDYSPLKLYWLVWHLPGFALTRAPGRFSFLFTFAVALLAAYGLQWLIDRARHARAVPTAQLSPHHGRAAAPLGALSLVAAALALALAAAVGYGQWWLAADRGSALALIRDGYLSLPHDPRFRIAPDAILRSLDRALDLLNPRVALAVGLLAGTALLFGGWSRLPRRGSLWQCLLVGLITFDLLAFATGFHPVIGEADLTRVSGPARFLLDQPGLHRHYHRGSPPPSTEPNRLMPLDRADLGGYSSLEMARVADFLNRLQSIDGALLDLANVRYLVQRKEELPLPSYAGVKFDVGRPLSVGVSANPNSRLELSADGVAAGELRLIGFLRQARDVPQGAEVGSVTVRDRSGDEQRFPLRAGIEIADETVETPAARPTQHGPAPLAFYRPAVTANGQPTRLVGSYIALPLAAGRAVEEVTVAFTYPSGEMQMVGAGLLLPSGEVLQLTHRAKYRTVFEDETGTVDENTRAMPRAFLVYEALPAPGGSATLDFMVAGPFDPRRQVVLDGPVPGDLPGSVPAVSEVRVDTYEERRVALSARTGAPAILVLTDVQYPGWHAYVDGTEQPILVADHIFRSVHLTAGDHRVEFRYDAASLRLGAAISGLTLLLLGGLGVALWRYRASTRNGTVAQ